MQYNTERLPADPVRKGRLRGSFDVPFFTLTVLLLTIGVIMVLSASFPRAYAEEENPVYYFRKQALVAVLGVGFMVFCSHFPIAFYRRLSFPLMAASVVLLLAVPVIGMAGGGARRWINLGFIQFQPSELAKVAVVLFYANMICRYRQQMHTFRYGVRPFAIATIAIVGLLMLEPHLSASIIICGITVVMIFVGGVAWKYILGGIGGIAALITLAVTCIPYVQERVTTWLHPFEDVSDSGYQTVQSLMAVGSGGFLGLGFGQSMQKYLYLPEEHNDYIFSIVCEELGFVGAGAILLLFALLILRGYWIAMHVPDRYSLLVCVGLTTLLAMQVFLNVAVVTNLIPCTGISLPFFSYGGTALLIQLGEMGIILSISRDIPTRKTV